MSGVRLLSIRQAHNSADESGLDCAECRYCLGGRRRCFSASSFTSLIRVRPALLHWSSRAGAIARAASALLTSSPSALGLSLIPLVHLVVRFLLALLIRKKAAHEQLRYRRNLRDALHNLLNLVHRGHDTVDTAHAVDDLLDVVDGEAAFLLRIERGHRCLCDRGVWYDGRIGR